MKSIYPNISAHQADNFFMERSILSCRNDDVDEINKIILDKFPGQSRIYTSADKVVLEDGADGNDAPVYPVEYLNTLSIGGLPLAKLELKAGCPLMLLRNLDPFNGLCNGTRLILLEMRSRVVRCRVLSGTHAGTEVLIPRISLEPSNEALGFKFIRRQFPVRLSFAMTINKSQGQSIHLVGLDLRTAVFAHGQLYVALSRSTSADRIRVLLPTNHSKTTNIVYEEILTGIV